MFNNLGLALGTNLKFYNSLSKGLRLNARKFWGLILTLVEVTREKLVGGLFVPPPPSWMGLEYFSFFVFQILFLCLNRAGTEPEILRRWRFKGIGKNVNVSLVCWCTKHIPHAAGSGVHGALRLRTYGKLLWVDQAWELGLHKISPVRTDISIKG